MSTILNLLTGAIIKLVTGGFSAWMDFSRQKELAIINAPKDTIIALQSGTDNADPWTRRTRRILALALVGTWVYIMYYVVVVRPDISYNIPINRHHSLFWQWLTPFPINDKGVVNISAGALLWEFKTMVEIITGFYFTKIGK